MKKALLAVLFGLLSGGAFAQACGGQNLGLAVGTANAVPAINTPRCACDGIGATNQTGKSTLFNADPNQPLAAAAVYAQQSFAVSCSANTMVMFNEVDATHLLVSGASIKGNATFIGSSNGGSVRLDPTANVNCAKLNETAAGKNDGGCLPAQPVQGLINAQQL